MNHLSRKIRSSSAVVLMVLAACVLVSFSTRAQAPAPRSSPAIAPAGNASNGKKLYNTIGCWECHGYSGQGGGAAGPTLAPNPMSLPGFTKYIRVPVGQMPPYTSKVVSDAQVADIYAFLKTIPRPRDSKEIPLLNQKER